MITTLGASLGARIGSGKAGFDSLIVRPMTPLNSGGSCGSLPDGWAAMVRPADSAAADSIAAKDKHQINAVTPSARELVRDRIRNVSISGFRRALRALRRRLMKIAARS